MPNNESQTPVSLDDLDKAPESLPTPSPASLSGPATAEDFQKLLREFADVSSKRCQLEEELSRERAKNTTRSILDDLIQPFAGKVFTFMCFYAATVACFVFYDGLDIGFRLPDSVMGYLVGSTAVTVLGLVGTVLTGIFVGARR